MALPTVGAKALHIAQLPPRVRKILAHRAKAAARREYAPILAADRGAFGTANRDYRAEAASARGATNATESALMQALGHVGGLGISGRYKQQLKNEFSSRAADTASALPVLLAGAQEERGDALREAQQQFASDRAQMLQSGAVKFNSELESQRDKASSVVAARQKEHQEAAEDHGLTDSEVGSLNAASEALKAALATWAQNPVEKLPNGEEKHLQQINPLKTIDDWRTLAHGLEKEFDGFNLPEAMQVISDFLHSRKRALHQGRLPQQGVPYGPRQEKGIASVVPGY
jgi:hypothetical protein